MSLSLTYRDLPRRYIRDPRLGHRLGRNFPSGLHYDEVWEHDWLGSNANGFYGQIKNYSTKKPAGIKRVILLGGSAAMGLGASNSTSLLANILESLLNIGHIKTNFEVLNCAVGDYSSTQSLIYFETELLDFQPDIVLALDGFNDFSHSTWGSKYSHGSWLPNTTRSFDDCLFAIQRWESPRERYVLEYAWKNSKIGILAQSLLSRKRNRVKTHSTHGMSWDNPVNWSVKPNAIRIFNQNVLSLAGLSVAFDFQLIHIIQPSYLWNQKKPLMPKERDFLRKFKERMPRLCELAPMYYEKLQESYVTLQEMLGDRFGKSNLKLLDWGGFFDSESEERFTDPIHFSDEGQRRIAVKIQEIITTT